MKITWAGYEDGRLAPGLQGGGEATYSTTHNLIKAHVAAYRLYHAKYRGTQQGEARDYGRWCTYSRG
jgi:lactase-phlorizin hydrolase